MKINVVRHVPFESTGAIGEWARAKGHQVSESRLFEGDHVPDPDAYDWLVVMGGPMSVNDESSYQWLVGEKRTVAAAIERGRTVVGVCLGAQLVASVLGARVFRNQHKEIGWLPVTRTADGASHLLTRQLEDPIVAFHWHGETFDLPAGAVHLARSEACEHQMFAYDGARVVGIQFHLEMTGEGIAGLVENCSDDLVPGPFVQRPGEIRGPESRLQRAHANLHSVLDRLADQPQSGGKT
jgi:GMP synthase (glutamine-hydrolysing)